MMKMILVKIFSILLLTLATTLSRGQNGNSLIIKLDSAVSDNETINQLISTSYYLDALTSSFSALSSLIKKENYRTKIATLNNPTSADLGFNLENEIQTALKPLLAKAKSTDPNKFSQIVTTIVGSQSKNGLAKSTIGFNPIFSTVVSLVSSLVIQEKKISSEDLVDFIEKTSKYFLQYEKLNSVNSLFDKEINRLNQKNNELQFDIKEFVLDMVLLLNPNLNRIQAKQSNIEDLLLKYLDKYKIELADSNEFNVKYPAGAITTAKTLAHSLQKIFNEYQKIYANNYQQVRAIILESKNLGKHINLKQVELSVKELDDLYNESKNSDTFAIKLNTLLERLNQLSLTEQRRK